jgi:hypothetical protein
MTNAKYDYSMYDRVIETISVCAVLCIAIMLGQFLSRFDTIKPSGNPTYRVGDHVMVVTGFFEGCKGRLHTESFNEYGQKVYTIRWDNPNCEGGSFKATEIMLLDIEHGMRRVDL